MATQYQIIVVVETDEPMTEENVVLLSSQITQKMGHIKSLSLASTLIGIPEDKITFVNTIFGEVKYEETKDEEIPVTPVVD